MITASVPLSEQINKLVTMDHNDAFFDTFMVAINDKFDEQLKKLQNIQQQLKNENAMQKIEINQLKTDRDDLQTENTDLKIRIEEIQQKHRQLVTTDSKQIDKTQENYNKLNIDYSALENSHKALTECMEDVYNRIGMVFANEVNTTNQHRTDRVNIEYLGADSHSASVLSTIDELDEDDNKSQIPIDIDLLNIDGSDVDGNIGLEIKRELLTTSRQSLPIEPTLQQQSTNVDGMDTTFVTSDESIVTTMYCAYTGEKQPLECGTCGRRFGRKKNLDKHLREHAEKKLLSAF